MALTVTADCEKCGNREFIVDEQRGTAQCSHCGHFVFVAAVIFGFEEVAPKSTVSDPSETANGV